MPPREPSLGVWQKGATHCRMNRPGCPARAWWDSSGRRPTRALATSGEGLAPDRPIGEKRRQTSDPPPRLPLPASTPRLALNHRDLGAWCAQAYVSSVGPLENRGPNDGQLRQGLRSKCSTDSIDGEIDGDPRRGRALRPSPTRHLTRSKAWANTGSSPPGKDDLLGNPGALNSWHGPLPPHNPALGFVLRQPRFRCRNAHLDRTEESMVDDVDETVSAHVDAALGAGVTGPMPVTDVVKPRGTVLPTDGTRCRPGVVDATGIGGVGSPTGRDHPVFGLNRTQTKSIAATAFPAGRAISASVLHPGVSDACDPGPTREAPARPGTARARVCDVRVGLQTMFAHDGSGIRIANVGPGACAAASLAVLDV